MYVEKPLGVAMAWAWKLRRTAAANKVVFQYGTQQRSSGEFTRAVELVRNGAIGKIKHVDAWCSGMRSPDSYAQVFADHFKDTEPAPVPAGLDYEMWIGPARCRRIRSPVAQNGAPITFTIMPWASSPAGAPTPWTSPSGARPGPHEPHFLRRPGEIPSGGLFDTIDNWDVKCRYANGVTMRFMCDRVAKGVPGLMDDPKKRPFMDHGTTFWARALDQRQPGALYAARKSSRRRGSGGRDAVIRSESQGRNFVEAMRSRRPTVNPLESAIRSDTISHLSTSRSASAGRSDGPGRRKDPRRRGSVCEVGPADAQALDDVRRRSEPPARREGGQSAVMTIGSPAFSSARSGRLRRGSSLCPGRPRA